ncbi:MAG: DivIVA domain-containing protein [Oscillospiraceae bacterium]|nr:DivIVA domain-containing protein [Oscillospiraceae bacterium]
MNAKEIIGKHFEKAPFNGYKTEEVDLFLTEVSEEFAKLQKENGELERKLEVLADKIREYRDDEEALKDALLIAQKQGNAIVAESKASAEKLTKETNESIAKKLAETKAQSEKTINDANEYSEKTRKDAEETAERIVSAAQKKADEIKAIMDKQQEIQENILQETRRETNEYRQRILDSYEEHIRLIQSLPEKCENDYVERVSAQVEKREEERRKKEAEEKAASERAAAAEKAAAAKNAAMQQRNENNKKKQDKSQHSAPENADSKKTAEKTVPEKTAENNLPFFNSNTAEAKPIRRGELKFGKNNDNK